MNMNKTIFTKETRRRREKCYCEGARDARRAYNFLKNESIRVLSRGGRGELNTKSTKSDCEDATFSKLLTCTARNVFIDLKYGPNLDNLQGWR